MIALLLVFPALATPLAWNWDASVSHRYHVQALVRLPTASWQNIPNGPSARLMDLRLNLLLRCQAATNGRHSTLQCAVDQASPEVHVHDADADMAHPLAIALQDMWEEASFSVRVGDDGVLSRFHGEGPDALGNDLLRATASCLEVVHPETPADVWMQKQSITQRPLRLTHEIQQQTDDHIDVLVFPTRESRSVQYARRYTFSRNGYLQSSMHVYSQTYPDTQPGFTPIYREFVVCQSVADDAAITLPAPGPADIEVPQTLP